MALVLFVPAPPKFSPDFNPNLNGLDDTLPTTWQMVPYKGSKYIAVQFIGIGRWSMETLNPHIATVSLADETGNDPNLKNIYRIDGLHHGKTFLIVRGQGLWDKGKELGRLEIEVKFLKNPFVQFFLVSDKAGHKTSFTEKNTKEWLDFANDRIFEPQINVRFKYLRTRPITIDEDLGNKINLRSIGLLPYVKRDDEAGRIWHKITDFGMLEPQVFNVFCVWNFDNDGDEGRGLAAFVASKVRITAKEMQEAGANYNMCVMKETNMEDDEKCGICNRYIFAHEAGHYLARFPYHTSNDDLLMTPGALGSRLLRSDADKMNPTNS